MAPRTKSILLLLVLSITSVIAVIMLNFIRNKPLTAAINAEATPSDATITLNSKSAHQGKNKVKPGSYKIVFTRNGFTAVSREISVQKDETRYVGAALVPSSSEFVNWYVEHPEDAKIAEAISSREFDQIGKNQTEDTPLIKSLPFVQPSFRIDYGISQKVTNDPSKFAIYIAYITDADREAALKWIRDKGVDPSTLEIIFQQY